MLMRSGNKHIIDFQHCLLVYPLLLLSDYEIMEI